MRAILNAEKEVAKGNLWRAREILQGSIPNAGYDCDLFESLGNVLLTMGDLPEAGRFLFLAGKRQPEYDEAIKIFLRKQGRSWRTLRQSFPRVAKLPRLSDYPDCVSRQLAELGFPKVVKGSATSSPVYSDSFISDVVGWLIIGSILMVMFLGIIKLIEIVRWII